MPIQVEMRGFERRKTALVILFLVFSAFVCVSAQGLARSVRGIVTDRDGAPLVSSVVQIEDEGTLSIRSFITGNDGFYYFLDLSPDRDYLIRARHGNVWGRAKTLSDSIRARKRQSI